MKLKYALLFSLGGCVAYTYDYGPGTTYGRAYAPMRAPLTREQVPPAPNGGRTAPQIYGLLPPAPQQPAAPLASQPRAATPAPPPAPVEPAGGRSAAEGLRLIVPPRREEAPRGQALSDPALRELLVLGAERSPAAAFGLAFSVGFGCGHYYAEDVGTAKAILGGELVGLGMMVLGHLTEGSAGAELGEGGLIELGALVFAGFRVYEVLTVTSAAKKYNQQLRAKFGLGVVPTRRGAMVGAQWRY